MHKIVFYSVTKDEQGLAQQLFKKLDVEMHNYKLSSKNFPNAHTEILSIHADCKITADIIKKLPNLKLIVSRTAGIDHIDMVAATKAGVKVANCAGQNAVSVAEFVFGLICNNYRLFPENLARGKSLNFDGEEHNGLELAGKTLGIIGTGSIGAHVAQIAKGFGMKTLGHDAKKNPNLTKQVGLRYVPIDKLIKDSDIITLHVPAIKSTIKMVNSRFLAKMKVGSLLVNTSRGAVVDTVAVIKALESGRLRGFAADVLEMECEPGLLGRDRHIWTLQKKLAKLPNVLLTPHTAHATTESTERIFTKTFQIIKGFQKGQKISFLN